VSSFLQATYPTDLAPGSIGMLPASPHLVSGVDLWREGGGAIYGMVFDCDTAVGEPDLGTTVPGGMLLQACHVCSVGSTRLHLGVQQAGNTRMLGQWHLPSRRQSPPTRGARPVGGRWCVIPH
jgi:hypothetical protein